MLVLVRPEAPAADVPGPSKTAVVSTAGDVGPVAEEDDEAAPGRPRCSGPSPAGRRGSPATLRRPRPRRRSGRRPWPRGRATRARDRPGPCGGRRRGRPRPRVTNLDTIARQVVEWRYGWSGRQWGFIDELITQESCCDPRAVNPSTGAYGPVQALTAEKLATAGDDWRTNPATQLALGLRLHRAALRHAMPGLVLLARAQLVLSVWLAA
ncbi:aggregation-promoting factor C-terminal-like domain-containing protein [Auraticoccus monumenti]